MLDEFVAKSMGIGNRRRPYPLNHKTVSLSLHLPLPHHLGPSSITLNVLLSLYLCSYISLSTLKKNNYLEFIFRSRIVKGGICGRALTSHAQDSRFISQYCQGRDANVCTRFPRPTWQLLYLPCQSWNPYRGQEILPLRYLY